MQLLKTRWFWLWTPITTVALGLAFVSAFALAIIGWLGWSAAAIATALLAGLIGMALGWFNAQRSREDLWLVAGVAASFLFLLVIIQYVAAIILLPPCDTPGDITNCFEDHSAAVGSLGALGGSALMAVLVGLGGGAGAAFRQWIGRKQAAPTRPHPPA
jgi:hypothetical protein